MMLFQRKQFFELMGNALTTLSLLLVVLVLLASAKVMSKVDGLGLAEFFLAIPVFVMSSLDIVIPLSVLVAVVLTYGRAAADNEIDTLRSSGVHPGHLLTPGLVFGLLMAAVMAIGVDTWKPYAERASRRLTRSIDVGQMLAEKLASGEPEKLDDNTIISAKTMGANGVLQDVTITRFKSDGALEWEMFAEQVLAYFDEDTGDLVVEPRNFRMVVGGSDIVGGTGTRFTRTLLKEDAKLSLRAFTTAQLLAWLQRPPDMRGRHDELQVRTEVAMRGAAPAVCVVFVLLGIPVALRFKRSDRVGAFLVAFLLALFFYFPSVKVSKALAENGTLAPVIAAWSGHGLLVMISALFARRVFRVS
ncbi:MAG: LPS export ABC transporter permease LptG [Planctomycetota bacterium]|nr:MAG: LPS export ABC transporter permease LptG [Planctomycetota bacterium]